MRTDRRRRRRRQRRRLGFEAAFRLEADEFFGYIIVLALTKNTQQDQSGFVDVQSTPELHPAGAVALFDHISQLHHSYTDDAVFTSETVVFDLED